MRCNGDKKIRTWKTARSCLPLFLDILLDRLRLLVLDVPDVRPGDHLALGHVLGLLVALANFPPPLAVAEFDVSLVIRVLGLHRALRPRLAEFFARPIIVRPVGRAVVDHKGLAGADDVEKLILRHVFVARDLCLWRDLVRPREEGLVVLERREVGLHPGLP